MLAKLRHTLLCWSAGGIGVVFTLLQHFSCRNTLSKNINILLFLHPFSYWSKRFKPFLLHIKEGLPSDFKYKFIIFHVKEHFSCAQVIHPPHRCGISGCEQNMINAQLFFQPITIKRHSKMCSVITQHTATMVINSEPVACWLQECPQELVSLNLMLILSHCMRPMLITLDTDPET